MGKISAPGSAASDESKWKAESDARTLCEAEAIKSDKGRMGKAAKAAKQMAKDKNVEAMAMRKIAAGKASGILQFSRAKKDGSYTTITRKKA